LFVMINLMSSVTVDATQGLSIPNAESHRESVETASTHPPPTVLLKDITSSDDNALAMLSVPSGGRISRCPSSGTTYLTLKNTTNIMNIVARTSQFADTVATSPIPASDISIQYAPHDVIANVFPTTAVLFTNESATADENRIRLYTLSLLDLVSLPEDESVTYRVEVVNVTAYGSKNGTATAPMIEPMFLSKYEGGGPVKFPSGSLMIDLVDVNDPGLSAERKRYTLAHMSQSGELDYQAKKLAAADGTEGLVKAQGGLTLWLLGPFSIPLYPGFIACCAASSLIWYTIQPFVFCCIF